MSPTTPNTFLMVRWSPVPDGLMEEEKEQEGEPPRAAPKRKMVPAPEGEPPRAAPKRQMVPAPKARLAWGGGALPAKNGAAATGPAPAGAATTEAPTGSPSVLLGLPGLPMGNVLAQRGGSSAGARRFVPPLPNRCLEGRCRCPDLSITRGPGLFEEVAPRQQNSQRRESGGTDGRPADPRPAGGPAGDWRWRSRSPRPRGPPPAPKHEKPAPKLGRSYLVSVGPQGRPVRVKGPSVTGPPPSGPAAAE